MSYNLDEAVGYWMNLAFVRLRVRTVERLATLGFEGSPEQWAMLVRLWERDDRTLTELAEATFRDKAGVTRLVDALVGKGLVERRADAEDRRSKRVVLTDAGRALEQVLVPGIEGFLDEVYAGISPQDLLVLRRSFQQIYANLEDDADK